jgi:hypothetical protein
MKNVLVTLSVLAMLAAGLVGCSNSYQKGYDAGYQAGNRQTAKTTTPQQQDVVFRMSYVKQNERLASIERAYVTNNSTVMILNIYVKSDWYDNKGAIVASTNTTVAERIGSGESASALIFPPSSVSGEQVGDYHLYWTWSQ